VEGTFPKALGIKYVTAPALQRQVWNAVLAITDEIQDTSQFRNNLLTKSNRQLLQEAYGTVPNGFRLALRKTGPYAQSTDFYIQLHQHLTKNPQDYRHLNGFTQLDERLIDILHTLPTPLKSFRYARRFSSPRDVNRFKDAYILLNHSEHENRKIWTDAAQQFDRGSSPQKIIQSKFNQAQFPAPVVTHRTKRTKGCLSRDGMLHMMFKLGQCAKQSWRKLRGFVHLADVIQGVDFVNGIKPINQQLTAA
jgi:hypothetical protein